MPLSLNCGELLACPDGKRPPLTNSTFTPKSMTDMPTMAMLMRTDFILLSVFWSANIGKLAKIFAD